MQISQKFVHKNYFLLLFTNIQGFFFQTFIISSNIKCAERNAIPVSVLYFLKYVRNLKQGPPPIPSTVRLCFFKFIWWVRLLHCHLFLFSIYNSLFSLARTIVLSSAGGARSGRMRHLSRAPCFKMSHNFCRQKLVDE